LINLNFKEQREEEEKKRDGEKATYVGKTTVGATAYLRLIDVDEDARVTEGTAAAVALDGFLLDPADGLFVDELDGCQWARLCLSLLSAIDHPLHLSHFCFLSVAPLSSSSDSNILCWF
jgi:hypothetical protein